MEACRLWLRAHPECAYTDVQLYEFVYATLEQMSPESDGHLHVVGASNYERIEWCLRRRDTQRRATVARFDATPLMQRSPSRFLTRAAPNVEPPPRFTGPRERSTASTAAPPRPLTRPIDIPSAPPPTRRCHTMHFGGSASPPQERETWSNRVSHKTALYHDTFFRAPIVVVSGRAMSPPVPSRARALSPPAPPRARAMSTSPTSPRCRDESRSPPMRRGTALSKSPPPQPSLHRGVY